MTVPLTVGSGGGARQVESGTGKQKNARHRSMPAFTMGRAKRFAEIPNYTPNFTPGPGAYE
jgi:hypothetical protein